MSKFEASVERGFSARTTPQPIGFSRRGKVRIRARLRTAGAIRFWAAQRFSLAIIARPKERL